MAGREELIDAIAGFGLFADLSHPQLEGLIHIFDERTYAEGDTVLKQGLSGSGFFVIVDGLVAVVIDGTERVRLGRGEYFGEISILLGVPAVGDVRATSHLRCLVLQADRLEGFLVGHPRVMFRMLQAQTRRLRAANRWGN